MSFFRRYSSLVQRAPYLTNCTLGFAIATAGDYLSQKYFEQPSTADKFVWNGSRSVDMGIVRATVITPFIMQWYPILVRLCPGGTVLRVAGRAALDQCIGSPVVICLVFLANSLLSKTVPTLPRRLEEQFYPTWKTGLNYWPFVHMINFGFVPLAHQPLVAHFASIYWNAVLSYYSNKAVVNEEDAKISLQSQQQQQQA